jgi:hypothetical protein
LQVERTIANNNGNSPVHLLSKTVPIKVDVPWDNLALVPQSFGRSVSVFRTDNYASIISRYHDNSNLLVATIPVGQVGDNSDGPRYVAVTGDRQRAYSTLEGSGQIAVIDLLTMRQIDGSQDPHTLLPDFNPTIDLPPGARPFTIAVDARDKYAYIDDARGVGVLTIVDDDFAAGTINYIPLGLGSNVDYFDVNEGVGITITKDGKYGFVAGRNSRN